MRHDAPKLRSDLRFVPREQLGDVIIEDELLERYHAIGPLEQEVFQLFDGARSTEEIARALSAKHRIALRADVVAQFAVAAAQLGLLDLVSDPTLDGPAGVRIATRFRKRLARSGFRLRRGAPKGRADERRRRHEEAELIDAALVHLQAGRLSASARSLAAVLEIYPANHRARRLLSELHACVGEARRPSQSILQYRIPLMDPHRLLAGLERVFGWAVRPSVAWLGLALFLAMTLAMVSQFEEIWREGRLIAAHWQRWIWLIIPMQVINWGHALLHELSHGLTCFRFGGKVRQIGLLYNGIGLGAYCDVSSAYTFQERNRRVAVALGGPVLDCWFTAALSGIFLLSAPGTTTHVLLLLVSVSRTMSLLLSVIPFFKDDLYFAISEATGVPNLLEKAGDWLRHLGTNVLLGLPLPPPQLEEREKRVVLTYGLVNVTFTTLLIVKTLAVAWRASVQYFRGTGVVLFVVALLLVVGRRLARALAYLWTLRSLALRTPAFRRRVAASLALGALAAFVPVREELVVECRVARERAVLAAPAPGRLTWVGPEPGEFVESGAELARVANGALRRELQGCELELTAAKAAHAAAEAAVPELELEPLRRRLQKAEADVGFARTRLARLERLARAGGLQASELADARTSWTEATAAASAARMQLEERRAGRTAEERAQAAAQEQATRARCESLADQVKALTVSAPEEGVVLWRRGERGEALGGEPIAAGEEIARLGTAQPPRIEMKLGLLDARTWAEAGRKLEVRLESAPGQPLEAVLSGVSPRADGADFAVTARLMRPADVPDQASCRARFSAGREPLWRNLHRAFAPLLEVGFWNLW